MTLMSMCVCGLFCWWILMCAMIIFTDDIFLLGLLDGSRIFMILVLRDCVFCS